MIRIENTTKHPLDGITGVGEIIKGYPRYVVRDGAIHAARVGRKESVKYERLANFAAIITRTTANGANYEIAGYLENGNPLPTIVVPANKFDTMRWVATHWGPAAIISPGARGKLCTAIKCLSRGRIK